MLHLNLRFSFYSGWWVQPKIAQIWFTYSNGIYNNSFALKRENRRFKIGWILKFVVLEFAKNFIFRILTVMFFLFFSVLYLMIILNYFETTLK